MTSCSKLTLIVVLVCAVLSAKSQSQSTSPADSTRLVPLKTQKAEYPAAASRNGIQGQVWLKFQVTETGDVDAIAVISGDPVLAESAIKALKKWKFEPFIKNGQATRVTTKLPFDFFFRDRVFEKSVSADRSDTSKTQYLAMGPTDPPSQTLTNSETTIDFAKDIANATERMRLSQGVLPGLLVHKIAPVYPEIAQRRHIEGTVKLQAVIGKDGRLSNLTPLSGPEELIPAAIGAVQQWRYKPYKLFDEPIEVDTEITVDFRLPH